MIQAGSEMFTKIANARISAIRAAVSTQEISIEDELEFYGGSLKKANRARMMIGTDKRHPAWPGQTASDLCAFAAQALLADYDSLKGEIGALIFVSQWPDYNLPATACILQDRLGLPKSCAAFDVNQGCAGYVYGLWLAASLVNSGLRNVLLLAGDASIWPRDKNNRVIAPIFGDGGSATLVSRDHEAPEISFGIGSDGSGHDFLIQPAGIARVPLSRDYEKNAALLEPVIDKNGNPWNLYDIYMNGKAVFEFTLRVVPDHIREFMERNSVSPSGIDYFVLHQANKQIVGEIAKKAGLPPEKTPADSFSRYGNLSSASIPAALCDLFGNAGTSGNASLLLCGFGVGLAWASCLWQARNCDIKPVLFAPKDENALTWEEKIEYWRAKISGASD